MTAPTSTTPDANVLFGPPPEHTAPPERHWFVPEAPDGHYCAACGLPERNGRHAPREVHR